MKNLAQDILRYKEEIKLGQGFELKYSEYDLQHYALRFGGIPEFIKEVRVPGMKSLALELGGHRPETKFEICEDKIKAWANENGIEFYFNLKERYYVFRYSYRY